MPEVTIRGVPVNFPFDPYQVQRDYMERVIECLQTGTHGVLESPTGTGKTLSLLCSSLAWLLTKKAEVQAARVMRNVEGNAMVPANSLNFLDEAIGGGGATDGGQQNWGVSKIIYASRTHSQLTQAMGEMKRTAYSYLKAAVIGSRDQLCIHPEVMNEAGNSNKVYLCRAKVKAKGCSFYSKIEGAKNHPDIREKGIMDIEDLVVAGRKHKCCPYYLSKEVIERADIVFMPYNYLLDPKARKATGIELHNSVIILDEAHNVEKMCEEAASIQLKSSDIAMCIDEVTAIMKQMDENQKLGLIDNDEDKEVGFSLDDLATLKEILLGLERTLDAEVVSYTPEGTTFSGSYIFDILAKASITNANAQIILKLLDELVQFITTMSEKNGLSGRGNGLSLISDMLMIVFASDDPTFKERVRRCYKVHIAIEEQKNNSSHRTSQGWTSKLPSVKSNAKVLSYWCFNPGFGMTQVLSKNVHSIILTSGTLAPLRPLISELGIPVHVRLENPHIIGPSQVNVKIISHGPDREPLISNYENRNNPKYIQSLGRTILSLCPIIPAGLLIFFPSYTILNKFQSEWIESGIWASITKIKSVFIEPRTKDEFNLVMNEYYSRINDPNHKGAIFMAVCRGKVSEGLDFADMNGRGVIITGLPFPPVKDPRVVLKRKYLEENRTQENQILSGAEWYGLEATRAVNQAIGRVIRHKNDYGCILLCDSRFNNYQQRNQLSRWVQQHLKQPECNFGQIIGDLSRFFKNAERTLPLPHLKPLKYESPEKAKNLAEKMGPSPVKAVKIKTEIKIENSNSISTWSTEDYSAKNIKVEFGQKPTSFLSGLTRASNSIDFNNCSDYSENLVTIHKRIKPEPISQHEPDAKKPKLSLLKAEPMSSSMEVDTKKFIKIEPKTETIDISDDDVEPADNLPQDTQTFKRKLEEIPEDRMEFLRAMKRTLKEKDYKKVLSVLGDYRRNTSVERLCVNVLEAFQSGTGLHFLAALRRYVAEHHRDRYDQRVREYLKPYGIEWENKI